jgi:hypothetical protein
VERVTGSNRQRLPDAKGKLRIGEKVIFNFQANEDGFITIVDIQPGGDVVILFPNDFSGTNQIQANKLYSIPSLKDAFDIVVSEPAGMDTVAAFFTRKKVQWLDRKKLEGQGFWTVKKKEKLAMSRGFRVVSTSLGRDEWESRGIEIEVVR